MASYISSLPSQSSKNPQKASYFLFGALFSAYPALSCSDLKAVLLLNAEGTNKLEASLERTPPPGGIIGFASSVMLHVGGKYQRKDKDTYITGSLGCSGIYKQKDGQFIGGNLASVEPVSCKACVGHGWLTCHCYRPVLYQQGREEDSSYRTVLVGMCKGGETRI